MGDGRGALQEWPASAINHGIHGQHGHHNNKKSSTNDCCRNSAYSEKSTWAKMEFKPSNYLSISILKSQLANIKLMPTILEKPIKSLG